MMSNDMMRGSAKEEYLRAQSAGLREKRELEAQGLSPYPTVLEEAFPGVSKVSGVSLPLVEIPADRIVGTVTSGRKSTFSASFLPLPEVGSEFSAKWIALCEAHLSDTGIRDPIECIEYLGNFYVREGNKRVSVLRWFGAVRIPAKVRRVMPLEKDSPRAEAYEEFLDFFKATGIYDIQFTKPGKYAKLLTALGKKPGDPWTEQEKKRLVSAFTGFKEAFAPFKSKDHALLAEDALLLFLKVYPFGQLTGMTRQELKKALSALWPDIVTTSDSGAITVKTTPDDEKKKSVISKLIAGTKHLNAAFICQNDTERSAWTRGHAEGAAYLAEALSDSVSVKTYFHADTPEDAERLIGEAVSDGADLVFTTTPQLLDATLKAAVKHPKVGFYNCSACQPFSSVKSYYCRIYEGKFITGLIAGALADNDLVGYVGSYPIMGVPASINAFALGARMTNPRAKILLEWSATEIDCVRKFRERGVRVISNRDIPTADASGGSCGGSGRHPGAHARECRRDCQRGAGGVPKEHEDFSRGDGKDHLCPGTGRGDIRGGWRENRGALCACGGEKGNGQRGLQCLSCELWKCLLPGDGGSRQGGGGKASGKAPRYPLHGAQMRPPWFPHLHLG